MEKRKDIYITQSLLPPLEAYVREISDIWDTHWLTHDGEKHNKLEKALKEHLAVEHAALFVNGHLALEAAIEAFDLKGEVITTPFTFPSTAHAIVRKGCTPIFCDIREDDFTMDASKIEALITDQTSAIIPVHILGNVCDVVAIDRIAKKYNLVVIYDAAHVFGTKLKGESIGNFGDASMFSMNATKVFNTIEGGLVTYKDLLIEKKLQLIKYYGMENSESITYPGSNLKMNEFQAAMGLCNLPLVQTEILKRRNHVQSYSKKLAIYSELILPTYRTDIEYSYLYYPVRIVGGSQDRDQVFEKMVSRGIHVKKYFYPLVTDYECYVKGKTKASLPMAEKISEQILCLPLYGDLQSEQVDFISETLISILK